MRPAKIGLTVMLIAIAAASSVNAPQNGFYIEYYSDETFTTMVGWRNYDCGGGLDHEGTISEYYFKETWSCSTIWQQCQRCTPWGCWFEACP